MNDVNTDELADRFWRDGYLVIDDFFDAQLMSRIDEEILHHFGREPEFLHEADFLEWSQTDVIPWFPQDPGVPEHSPARAELFDQLSQDLRLKELTHSLLGEGWRELYSMVMFSKQGSNGQAWHQDCPPEDHERHNLNRLVYTRDLSEEIGGQTVVVPGSHRHGEIPAGDPSGKLPGEVVLSPRCGTLVVIHGHTWHRVLPVTGPFRFSTNYRACPATAPDDVTDICVYRNLRYRFSTKELLEMRHS